MTTRRPCTWTNRHAETEKLPEADRVLGLMSTATLLRLAEGSIDVLRLIREEIAARGLDTNGQWVGFDQAATIHLGRKGA